MHCTANKLEEKKGSSSQFSLLTPDPVSDSLHEQQCSVPTPAALVFLPPSASQIHLGTDTCAAFQSIEARVGLSILVLTVLFARQLLSTLLNMSY